MAITASPKQSGSKVTGAVGSKTMPRSKPIKENQNSGTGSFAPDSFHRAGYPGGRPIHGLGQKG